MAVKVKLNRASLRFEDKLLRQVNGKVQNTKRLVARFERSGKPKEWASVISAALQDVHARIMAVFEGSEPTSFMTVSSVQGVDLARPWQPLSFEYMQRKKTDAFWRESGELLEYVAKALAPLEHHAVKRVEVKAGKVPRGAKTVRVSVLVTPARLPEPLQSLVMYPFLQGKGNDLTAIGGSDVQTVKLLVNHAMRGFIPEIAAEFGNQLLDELRS